jgi:hypothetical protein
MPDINIKECKSKTELFNHFNNSGPDIIIGADAEAPNKYYSLSFQNNEDNLAIGIISSGFGINPEAILSDNGITLFIGHDANVTGIDLVNKITFFNRMLNGVFFKFLSQPDGIIIIHELGVLKINFQGIELWSIDLDIVGKYFIDADEKLRVQIIEDNSIIIIDLKSGNWGKDVHWGDTWG